jgi:ribosomal protein S12 methylthiotransferase accessory factor
MEMIITFPGGQKVDSQFKGHTVRTDQPEKAGGEGSSPSPFDLFFHSIGTCAGYYVLSFCQERDIPTEDIRVLMNTQRDSETKMVKKIDIDIQLPKGFPEKYLKAVKASADKCTVKKHILHPPAFNIAAQIG